MCNSVTVVFYIHSSNAHFIIVCVQLATLWTSCRFVLSLVRSSTAYLKAGLNSICHMLKLGGGIATIPSNTTPWLSITYDLVISNKNSHLSRPAKWFNFSRFHKTINNHCKFFKNIRSTQTWFSKLENDKIIIQVYVLKQDVLLNTFFIFWFWSFFLYWFTAIL